MKQLGLWLDSDRAVIIDRESHELTQLESNVEHFNLKGGSRSKTAYGPMEVRSESKLEERRKHQLNDYFKVISEELGDFDELVVFGPSQTKIEFMKFMRSNPFKGELHPHEPADNRFTDNQLFEWVDRYYSH